MKYYVIKNENDEFLSIDYNDRYVEYELYLYKKGLTNLENSLFSNMTSANQWLKYFLAGEINFRFMDEINLEKLQVCEVEIDLNIKIK